MLSLADLITPNLPERRPVRAPNVADSGVFQEDALALVDALDARKPEFDEGVVHGRR